MLTQPPSTTEELEPTTDTSMMTPLLSLRRDTTTELVSQMTAEIADMHTVKFATSAITSTDVPTVMMFAT